MSKTSGETQMQDAIERKKIEIKKPALWGKVGPKPAVLISIGSLFIYLAGVAYQYFADIPGNGISDFHVHDFRQAQTALVAYWLREQVASFPGEIPVFGAPWKVPMEFPLYQIAVAYLSSGSAIDLIPCARFVSIVSFLTSVVYVHFLTFSLLRDRLSAAVVSSLLLMSPLYIFWSRAVMIESLALMCMIAFSYHMLMALQEDRKVLFNCVVATLYCALSATIKVSTWAGGLAFLAIYAVMQILKPTRPREVRITEILVRRETALAIGIVFTAAIVLAAWTTYANSVKSQNVAAGALLTSSSQLSWLTGSYAEKIQVMNPLGAFAQRVYRHTFGSFLPVIAIIICGALLIREGAYRRFILSTVGAFFVTTFVFANVHLVHNYYQFATSVFLVMAVGASIGFMLKSKHARVLVAGVCVLIVVAVSMQKYYYSVVRPRQAFEANELGALNLMRRFGEVVKERVPKNSSVVIHFGDWNPYLTYFSERKSIMTGFPQVPDADPNNQIFKKMVERTTAAGYPVGAVVFCGAEISSPFKRASLAEFGFSNVVYKNEFCELYQ